MTAPTPSQQAILDAQWDRVAAKVAAKTWTQITDPNVLKAQGRTLLTLDTGVGANLAKQIADLTAAVQRLTAQSNATAAKVAALTKPSA
jgi:hypothetical protein